MIGALDRTLTDLATTDASVRVIVADQGDFQVFRAKFPNRFINVGVAEANATGVAAGLASEGHRVFLFSVAGFLLSRGLEHLKFSIGYWKQPVCIIGTGFGWQFHLIGRGHHAADDIAIMRTIPNIRILTPCDGRSLPTLLLGEPNGPLYLRLGVGLPDPVPTIHEHQDADVIVIALGEMVKRCIPAVSAIQDEGASVALIGIERFDVEEIQRKLAGAKHIVVVEDHIAMGGLGALVREAGFSVSAHVHSPVLLDCFTTSEAELAEACGLDTRTITDKIRMILQQK